MSVFLKVCCIASVDEARLAIEAGAAALGLVSRMPSGPGVIDDDTIAEIAVTAPREIETFLLTCERTAEAIVAQVLRTRVSTVQIVDHVPPSVLREVRMAAPRARVVQVVHVEDERALAIASDAEPFVDALLLDSGSPSAAVLGGTGRTHDWSLSRRICERARVPVLLAGGLKPSNVATAVATVRPAGLDVCSGVRAGGALDEALLRSFASCVSLRRPPMFTAHDGVH